MRMLSHDSMRTLCSGLIAVALSSATSAYLITEARWVLALWLGG